MLAGLHEHNHYSLLDGAGTAEQHVAAAVEAGYLALAETNHGTLAGSLHHMRACREGGIMPLVGCEAYYRPNRKVQGQKEWQYVKDHLTFIAKNHVGWLNLCRMISESHRSGYYQYPCVDPELIDLYHEGLICMTGCLGGQLASRINAEDEGGALQWVRYLQSRFGDDLVFEMMGHDIDEQRHANVEGIRIADRYGIIKAATIDGHYPKAHWAPVQDALLMIATNQTVNKREKKRQEGEDVYEFSLKTFYHQTVDEIKTNYAAFHPAIDRRVVEESITNTLEVAGRCVPFLIDPTDKRPSVSFPNVVDNAKYLRQLAHEGLARRGYVGVPEYEQQVDFECDVFEKLDSVNQILIVWEFINWCKSDRPVPTRTRDGRLVYDGAPKRLIMVGPGRGSAGGSTVCWAIGITDINPQKHGTLFERFLNPVRTSKPDIDIDLPPSRIDQAEDFVKVRFGKNSVIDIIAHSTFGPRAAITDVFRVLSIPYDHVKAATKTIDDKARGSLEEIRAVNAEVDKLATENPEAWEIARLVQKQVARKSEHAGGLLILPEFHKDGRPAKIEEFIPVERQGGQKGKLLSAFGERAGKGNQLISDLKLEKIDALRVAELDKQQYAVDLIEARTGVRVDLSALEVHDDPDATDPLVMQGFADGKFVGVFQWSGVAAGVTRKAKPKTIFDLASINALIRPSARGAGLDEQWVRRMRGEEEITYWHPVLEPYMRNSKGVLAFQEQLIEVAHHLGGLSRAEADLMRRIASKYYRVPAEAREMMGSMFDDLRVGMLAKGLSDDEIITILDTLISFSDYSFNLAHAVGYSLLAYRDMWLKTYYPHEFYAAFLSKGLSKVTKKRVVQKQEAAREARMCGLKIMPPDVNTSGRDYTVSYPEGIRFGLESIKHIGPATCTIIEEFRPFESYDDLERRVPSRLNVQGKAALIDSGACDRWGMRERFTEERIDERERDLLGMSLTSVYSIAQYQSVIDGNFWTADQVEMAPEDTPVAVAGEVTAVKEFLDKNGNLMAFVDLAYGPNHYSCTVFSGLYAEFTELIASRRPLLVTGEKNTYKGRVGIAVKGLPPDADGRAVAPIMDFSAYVDLIGDQAEELASDSVFPEDLAEAVDWTGQQQMVYA